MHTDNRQTHAQTHTQTGAALLTVLLLLVLVMVLVGSISVATRQMMADNAHRQASITLMDEQARQSAVLLMWLNQHGGRLYSTAALEKFVVAPPIKPSITTTVQFGTDSGKLNLNQLYHDNKADDNFIKIAKNGFVEAGIARAEVDTLTEHIISYIDGDNTLPTGGNEPSNDPSQGVYFANRPMQTLNELLYLPNMTGEKVQKLGEIFVVSPMLGTVNVNDMTPPVLKAIAPMLNASELAVIASLQTKGEGFVSNQTFWQLPPFNGLDSSLHTLTDVRITRVSAVFASADENGNRLVRRYHFAKNTAGQFVLTYVTDEVGIGDGLLKK
ncbi:MAG: type II secretion system protein GspK [Moraxella sp.]|nr:type II secretion system protein GspK [Moraxella sp.]